MNLQIPLSWWLAPVLIALVLAAFALLLRSRVIHSIYKEHMGESARERLFIASLAFLVAVGVIRGLTELIHAHIGPFHDVSMRGRHIHHLVWGILTLLLVGYLWLAEIGTGKKDGSIWIGRLTAALYGAGSALTLDEFALWLNLRDVYWEREGRASLEALAIFGALLSLGLAGSPLFRGIARRVWGRRN